VADLVEQWLGKDELVEIGCGKGFFLELLAARGCTISGFDPTYEGSNPRVQRSLFTSTASFRAKGIVLRHVLEHIVDPVAFLAHVRDGNAGDGRIYIEVPCFDWVSRHRAWFDIFYEHVNYFRLEDFSRLFDRVIAAGLCTIAWKDFFQLRLAAQGVTRAKKDAKQASGPTAPLGRRGAGGLLAPGDGGEPRPVGDPPPADDVIV
jgi:SAM-dependent methyltransferase